MWTYLSWTWEFLVIISSYNQQSGIILKSLLKQSQRNILKQPVEEIKWVKIAFFRERWVWFSCWSLTKKLNWWKNGHHTLSNGQVTIKKCKWEEVWVLVFVHQAILRRYLRSTRFSLEFRLSIYYFYSRFF